MDNEEYRKRYDELKQHESFYRVQSASDVLSILSYKWSQVGGEPDVGQSIWKGVNDASHVMTKIIMEHVPTQEQDRAFAALADFINYTFVISAHERDRKESKAYLKKILKPAHDGAKKKGNTSRDITRKIARERRGPNGEALTAAQLLKHVQAERVSQGHDPLGQPRKGKVVTEASAVTAIQRHLKDFDY